MRDEQDRRNALARAICIKCHESLRIFCTVHGHSHLAIFFGIDTPPTEMFCSGCLSCVVGVMLWFMSCSDHTSRKGSCLLVVRHSGETHVDGIVSGNGLLDKLDVVAMWLLFLFFITIC